jgi:predicted glutamine amidotransferase
VYSNEKFKTRLYRPVGTTDSELAFCLLMEKMSEIWKTPDIMPDFQTRLDTFKSFVQEIREIGPLNILYSDGEVIFAHGHRRHNPITDKIETPGLYYTQVFCADYEQKIFETYESGVTLHGRNNLITLFASVPLSDRNWKPVQEGEIFAVKRGQIVYRSSHDQLSA